METLHLAADLSVIASFATVAESNVRVLRDGDLHNQRERIMRELLELRDRIDGVVSKWGDRL